MRIRHGEPSGMFVQLFLYSGWKVQFLIPSKPCGIRGMQ